MVGYNHPPQPRRPVEHYGYERGVSRVALSDARKIAIFIHLLGSVAKVEMVTVMVLIYKELFPSISTFETLPPLHSTINGTYVCAVEDVSKVLMCYSLQAPRC